MRLSPPAFMLIASVVGGCASESPGSFAPDASVRGDQPSSGTGGGDGGGWTVVDASVPDSGPGELPAFDAGDPPFDAGFVPPGDDGGICAGGGQPDPGPLVPDGGLDMPLPVTGSTLFVSQTSGYAIAVNPDAPSISFIHVGAGSGQANPSKNVHLSLTRGDWPYKPVEDSSGNVHVLLRGPGELLTTNPATPQTVRRTALCKQPRGLVHDAAQNVLYVACAEGAILTVQPSTGAITARVDAPNDLRDVVLINGSLYATRFRSAEIFPVASPTLVRRAWLAPSFSGPVEATVAWKTVPLGNGVAMMHQRSSIGAVQTSCSGYGSGPSSIVTDGLSLFVPDGGVNAPLEPTWTSNPCGSGGLPVDIAVSPDQTVVGVVEAGTRRLFLLRLGISTSSDGGLNCPFPAPIGPTSGPRPLAIGFTADNRVVLQTEEPAVIVYGPYYSVVGGAYMAPGAQEVKATLPGSGVAQTGHRLFHDATAGNIACASCHPEGLDDGHVWTFASVGGRRTQTLAGGIGGTQPFHWDGDMHTFSTLMSEVMERRMSGPKLDVDRQAALLAWIHAIPAQRAPAKDAAAAARGKVLFESSAVGCSGCHNGAAFTNNSSANVGTGGTFQVPTLIGLGTRAPFMHDGCAKTLADRFGSCGGGDQHGTTSQLTQSEIADLVAYLSTL